MKKVITYGTYDLLHKGHIRLLERAKALGDYLIVGVTSDDFDKSRGKINVTQTLIERIEALKQTGLADEVIVEEYEGQKIDDIQRYGVDIFTVGSDWIGKFDYLNDYCKVVYLDRTQGISSSEIRSERREIKLGIIGESHIAQKYILQSKFVNGLHIISQIKDSKNIDTFFDNLDAVYVISHPSKHFEDCKMALEAGKHVICESPIALSREEASWLLDYADNNNLILLDAIKTAYSTAFSRMLLLAKAGKIGKVVNVNAVCTSLKNLDYSDSNLISKEWNSMTFWGPTTLLPIFQLLGNSFENVEIFSSIKNKAYMYDDFSNIFLKYKNAVGFANFGSGVKSEGQLIVSGTEGYIYVPAPWWKMDYFEIRRENQSENRRYFYQLDGEGIRELLVAFERMVEGSGYNPISRETTLAICSVMEKFHKAAY